METFTKLFERFLVFVYHCFDRIVIQGYLPLLTRPEHIVHFFGDVHGQYPITLGQKRRRMDCLSVDKRPVRLRQSSRFWPSARWNIGDGWKATPATTRSPS
jgi:hypothetical protein